MTLLRIACCSIAALLLPACSTRTVRSPEVYSWEDRPQLPAKQPTRPAAAGELQLTRLSDTRSRIFNPTSDSLVFSVHVKGDTQWVGSQRAQMARETYLPPKASLIVEDLVWVTPRMDRAADRGS